ncbi:MAG TPA: cupin domain-containing protein [Burkholderiaceae bacterium]
MVNTKKMITAVIASSFLIAYQGDSFAETKPQKTQGIEPAVLQQFPLAAQVPAMDGYELRGRRIIIAPGGTITEHSHADRPGIVYILEGSLTEHRKGVGRVVKPGDTWAEEADTIHWIENTTDKPAVIWAVDLVKKQ